MSEELNSECIYTRRLYIGQFVALFEELESIVFLSIVGSRSNLQRTPRYTFPSFGEVVDQLVPLETDPLTHWTEMMYSARNS